MSLFERSGEPVFLKEGSGLQPQIEALETLVQSTPPGAERTKLEQRLRNFKRGLRGETQIAFELKHSHLPIYVIQDLCIEDGDLTAQIDFVVVTNRLIFILECKNLYGNIEIDQEGVFFRKSCYGKVFQRERFYSPITQNERHVALLKHIKIKDISGVKRMLTDYTFDSFYRPVVVLANSQGEINVEKAPKAIREQMVHVDQLLSYIKDANKKCKEFSVNDKLTREIAQRLLALDKSHAAGCVAEPHEEGSQPLGQAAEDDRSSLPKSTPQRLPEATPQPLPEAAPPLPEAAPPHQVAGTPMEVQGAKTEDENEPPCPRCGAKMVKRKAGKGDRAGKEFWGCSNYPRCHGIVNL